jgi:hypothetical protein
VSKLSGYVQQLANYKGGDTPGGAIKAGEITQRTLQVVLPKGQLTADQFKALAQVGEEAEKKGVRLEIYQLK